MALGRREQHLVGPGAAANQEISPEEVRAFVSLDVRKATISVAAADNWQGGEVRYVGTIENTPDAIGKGSSGINRSI